MDGMLSGRVVRPQILEIAVSENQDSIPAALHAQWQAADSNPQWAV